MLLSLLAVAAPVVVPQETVLETRTLADETNIVELGLQSGTLSSFGTAGRVSGSLTVTYALNAVVTNTTQIPGQLEFAGSWNLGPEPGDCTPSLVFALLLPAAAASAATIQSDSGRQPMPSAAKHAGTYHVQTGTWSRTRAAAAGPNTTIYSNEAPQGLFLNTVGPSGVLAGGKVFDQGAVPGLTNPGPFTGTVLRETNSVDGVTIAYCDLDPTARVAGWDIEFFESYSAITSTGSPSTQPFRTGLVQVTGLPSNGCWIMDLDLTGSEFCLASDGGFANPGFSSEPGRNTFGVAMRYTGTGTSGAGPMLAGNPAATDASFAASGAALDAQGTYFGGGPQPCPGSGTTGYRNPDNLGFQGLGISGVVNISDGSYQPSPSVCGPTMVPHSGLWLALRAASEGTWRYCQKLCPGILLIRPRRLPWLGLT